MLFKSDELKTGGCVPPYLFLELTVVLTAYIQHRSCTVGLPFFMVSESVADSEIPPGRVHCSRPYNVLPDLNDAFATCDPCPRHCSQNCVLTFEFASNVLCVSALAIADEMKSFFNYSQTPCRRRRYSRTLLFLHFVLAQLTANLSRV